MPRTQSTRLRSRSRRRAPKICRAARSARPLLAWHAPSFDLDPNTPLTSFDRLRIHSSYRTRSARQPDPIRFVRFGRGPSTSSGEQATERRRDDYGHDHDAAATRAPQRRGGHCDGGAGPAGVLLRQRGGGARRVSGRVVACLHTDNTTIWQHQQQAACRVHISPHPQHHHHNAPYTQVSGKRGLRGRELLPPARQHVHAPRRLRAHPRDVSRTHTRVGGRAGCGPDGNTDWSIDSIVVGSINR